MKQEDFTWKTADGMNLFWHLSAPEAEPRGVIVLVHGLGEHCLRYQHVAEKFVAAGYALLGFDHRGHGRSDGVRGHIASYDLVMGDIQHFLDEAAARFPGKPRFIYGHSMGGNFTLYFLLNKKPNLAGAIVTSPGLAVAKPVSPVTLLLGKIMYKLNPSMKLSNGLDRSGLSRDPNVEKVYSADPLVHGFISARLALDMLNNGQWIIAHANELALPLLLMQGSADRLVNPPSTAQFAASVKRPDFTFKMWDGFYHELHNEPEKDQVIQMMVDFLNQHS